MTSTTGGALAPISLVSAHAALGGLGALLNAVSPETWNSLARPDPGQLAHLVWSIRARLDQGIEDAGLILPD